jgi:hypothetical protein
MGRSRLAGKLSPGNLGGSSGREKGSSRFLGVDGSSTSRLIVTQMLKKQENQFTHLLLKQTN